MLRIQRILFAAVAAGALHGQITQLDLHYQGRDVDFSTANATKPFKSGTGFPSICAIGEMFFKVDGPPGANLYGCTSLNSWTLEQTSYPTLTGNSGKVMTTDGTSLMFGSLGGDISGPVGAATVTQIQGRAVSSAAPGSGQALAWNASTTRWEPQTISGSGGGATTASQLGDFAVTRTSATVLTIGANCSVTTPCTVRFGALAYSFAAGASVTISAGTGAAYVYISSAGALTVGHNMTLACSGCTAQSGVVAFPFDSVPLWTWTATSATWDSTGGNDKRAFLAGQPMAAGAGILLTSVGGIYTPSLDTSYALNRNTFQSGVDIYCADTSANATHGCLIPTSGMVLTDGMQIPFRAGSTQSGAQTLTVTSGTTSLGVKNLFASDGISPPSFMNGRDYTLKYDASLSSGAGAFKLIDTVSPNIRARQFGTSFGETTGSALTSGSVVYLTVAYACTISAWNMVVDAGTATVDIWKIGTGTSIPTVANTITAAVLPAISSGTALHSTNLTGWTTAVSANDIFGFQLKALATAKFVEVDIECDQQ